MMHRAAAVLPFLVASAVFAAGGSGCNSLTSLESCASNADCARGTGCDESGKFCAEGGPIRIGVVAPLTGVQKLRGIGDDMRAAVDFASWLLDEGEVRPLDRGVAFTILDDESDATAARLRAQTLVDDNVVAVLGPMTSGQMLEAQKASFPKQVLHLGPTLGAAALGDAQPAPEEGRFLLQLSPDVANGSPLGLVYYLKTSNAADPSLARCSRTFVFHNDDVTGRDFKSAYETLFRTNGMCVRASAAIPVDAKQSYSEEVAALRAAKADCVVLGVNPAPAGKILETVEREIPAAERAFRWLGNSATHVPGFLETSATRTRAENFYGSDVDYTPIERTEYQELLELYKRFLVARGAAPEDVVDAQIPPRAVPITDSLILLGLALERAGRGASPAALRDAYLDVAQFAPGDETFSPISVFDAMRAIRRGRAIDYSGGSSDVEFDARGFYTGAPSQIWRVKDGKFERVQQVTERQAAVVKAAKGDGCAK